MSVRYQSWEVGSGQKAFQCVMDAGAYRWHNQTDSAKTNFPTFSMYIRSSHEASTSDSSTTKSCSSAQSGSPVSSSSLRHHGECGPVSSFVLPSCPGGDRVPLIGEDLEVSKSSYGWNSNHNNSQRGLRNACSFAPVKVHPHDDDDTHRNDTTFTSGLTTDCLVLPTTPNTHFQDCVGPYLSSSSSSIGVGGEHSLSSSDNDDSTGDGEVQSALRGPLNLSSLEDSLPIRRGLSRYFSGQSKSFGCLSDALSTSLAKPANPYAKKRRGLSIYDYRHRTFPSLSRTSASGISKKTSFGNRSNLALAVAMEAAEVEEDEEDDDEDHPTPLPRMGWSSRQKNKNAAPSRSYSLSDLQGAGPTRAFSFSDLQSAGAN